MERKPHIDLFGASALIAFAFLLGLNQVVIKVSNGGFQPVFMAGLRSVGAALVVLAWIKVRGLDNHVPDGGRIWGLALGALFASEFICIFFALDITSVARVSILFYTMPLWLSIAAHFLIPDERIHGRKAVGLLLALAGIVLAFADRGEPGQGPSLLGDILSLIAAFGWAGIALIVRLTPMGRASPETQLFWQLSVSAPILLGASLFFGPFFRDPEAIHIAGLAFQIFAVASFGFLTWFWLMSVYPASGVASFSFLSPVFSVLLGWLLLGEDISAQVWLALAFVSLGIMLINRPPKVRL
jgi:drug/metabolite transporter (DMT)-like permease